MATGTGQAVPPSSPMTVNRLVGLSAPSPGGGDGAAAAAGRGGGPSSAKGGREPYPGFLFPRFRTPWICAGDHFLPNRVGIPSPFNRSAIPCMVMPGVPFRRVRRMALIRWMTFCSSGVCP